MVNLRLSLAKVVLGIALLLAFGALACSGDDSRPAPAVTVNGDWQGNWNSNSGVGGTLTLHLVDNGGAVSGTMNVVGSPCGNQTTVSGSVSGYNVVLTTAGNDAMRFTATVQQNNQGTMTGSYSIMSGQCQGDSGTFNISTTAMPAPSAQPFTVPTPPMAQTQNLASTAQSATDAGL